MRCKSKLLTATAVMVCLFTVVSYAKVNQAFYDYRQGNYLSTASKLNKLADKGHEVALYYRAMSFIYGYGEIKNLTIGLRLLAKSGELGYLPAQLFLAKYYLLKQNNPQLALQWFKKSGIAKQC